MTAGLLTKGRRQEYSISEAGRWKAQISTCGQPVFGRSFDNQGRASEPVEAAAFQSSPCEAIGLGLFGLLGNVLAGAYVFEITRTVNGVQILDWAATPSSRSFWLLVVVLIAMGLYGWGAARYETGIRRALSEADVLGIALQELVGPMIEAAKKDIVNGRLRTLEDVKKMFGPGRESGPR